MGYYLLECLMLLAWYQYIIILMNNNKGKFEVL